VNHKVIQQNLKAIQWINACVTQVAINVNAHQAEKTADALLKEILVALLKEILANATLIAIPVNAHQEINANVIQKAIDVHPKEY